MKRVLISLFVVVFLAFAGSCTRDYAVDAIHVTATISAASDDTKVAYDHSSDPTQVIPSWEVNDTVFGWDDRGETFTFTVETVTDGVATMDIGDYVPGTATRLYAIYYPGKSVNDLEGSGTERTLSFNISSQAGSLTSSSPALMCATAEIIGGTSNLRFHNQTAIIGVRKFKVDPNVKVTGFSINGVMTSGQFEVVDGNLFLATTDDVGSITAGGLALEADADGVVDPGLWFAALPSAGAVMSLDATTDGGTFTNVTAIPATDLAAGHYYWLTKVMDAVVASVDEEKFTSFEAALAAANGAEYPCTLTLLDDVKQDAVAFSNPNTVTLDLNGRTLTAPVTFSEGAKCIITGEGTMKLPGTTGCLITTNGSCALTIESGTFNGPTSSNDSYSCLRANGASGKPSTITINGGTFTCGSQAGIVRSYYSTVTVNDAVMTATSAYGRDLLTSTAGNIVVNGGVFTAGNACVVSWVAGGAITINGGTFKSTHSSRGVFFINANLSSLTIAGGFFGSTKTDVITFASGKSISSCMVNGGRFSNDASSSLPAESGYQWCELSSHDNSTISGCELTHEVLVQAIQGDANVYGYVRCGGAPVPDVVVTDGYLFTKTDQDGKYALQSSKEYGFVEISIPSGYRVQSSGVIPLFFARLNGNVNSLERHDFNLLQDADQTRHTMLFFTDPHLAKEYNDIATFRKFEEDINDYIATHPSENIFAATGGDMSFDKKWYRHNYLPANYLTEVNNAFSGSKLQIFHCIGNHDHELGKENVGPFPAGEIACSQKYKDALGPTFYSYNIGQAHYICLDDIFCTNDGGGTASYKEMLEPYMLEWLKNDLSYVDKSKVIVLQMHAPLWNVNGTYNLEGADDLVNALHGRRTYILSGHNHRVYTVDHMDDLGIIELNSGSVCGTWWATSYYTPGLVLNREGTPGGYRIFKVDGTDVSWQFKAFGRDISEQFRTYDLNSIHITPEKYSPNMPESLRTDFNNCMWKFTTDWQNNRFFILVYDYDPRWQVEVSENGTPLEVTEKPIYDPLHMIAYETIRFNAGSVPTSSLRSLSSYHWLLAVPKSKTSTLEVKVTDRFGRVYTRTVTRPQPFSIEEYL